MEKQNIITIVAALFAGSIGGAVISEWSTYTQTMEAKERVWKEQQLAKVIGPVVMHLDRTERNYLAYRDDRNNPQKAERLKNTNNAVRKVLIDFGYLLPYDLIAKAQCLVYHYDDWEHRYTQALEGHKRGRPFKIKNSSTKSCASFPKGHEDAFHFAYCRLHQELSPTETPNNCVHPTS